MEPWNQLLAQLEDHLGKQTVDRWLRPLLLLRFDAANLYLQAQNTFQIDWFEEHIRPILQGQFLNNNQRPIRIHLSLASNIVAAAAKQPLKKENVSSFSIGPDPIDPEMSLENFIFSDQNKMAFQISSEIENSPFNPIFLYGPKNSGKTHLLMGIALELKKKKKRVFFIRAEHFTEHVVQALRLGMMQEFRKIYREIDALIIDDIHIFSRKGATQEEFFHTFNALHTHLQTIVLSAHKAPSSMEDIEPRLISRFEWGLSLRLEPIDPKTILKKKAELWRLSVSPELLSFLSEQFPSSPLVALQALALRAKEMKSLTPQLAETLLQDLLEKEAHNRWTADRIIKKTANYYGIRVEDVIGKSQTKEMAQPRQLAMYLCREKLKLPYQAIGKIFDRDHSTVMASVKQIEKAMEENHRDLTEAARSIFS
jgi:chromosomal replication initiator protein